MVLPVSEAWRDGREADTRRRPWLTYSHIGDMFFHMRTTVNISDSVMKALKREAAATGRTMSELVESALRVLLKKKGRRADLPELPVFDGGRARTDVSNREALYDFLETR